MTPFPLAGLAHLSEHVLPGRCEPPLPATANRPRTAVTPARHRSADLLTAAAVMEWLPVVSLPQASGAPAGGL